MNFEQDKLQLDFVKHRRKYFLFSSILIGLGLLILAVFGLNLGVDFAGGTQLEVLIEEPFTPDEIEDLVEGTGVTPGEIRLAGNNNEIARILFIGTITQEEINRIEDVLEEAYGEISVAETTVSPAIARELTRQAVWAVVFASIGIIIYVSIRFEYRFAIAAIIALLHDAFFIIAIFSILRLQVDLTFIAAVLTIVGYSINDTIVIFDRIRENLKFAKIKTVDDLSEVVNRSIVNTLARSINTSLTVVFAAAMLFFFAGEGIRNFSFALLIGLLVGAYSSIFIAAQVWLTLKAREIKQKLLQAQNQG